MSYLTIQLNLLIKQERVPAANRDIIKPFTEYSSLEAHMPPVMWIVSFVINICPMYVII